MTNRKSVPLTGKGNDLIDALIERLHLKNDAALARALQVAPPVISKIRHETLPIGGTFLINAHELSDISIKELKEISGLKPFNQK